MAQTSSNMLALGTEAPPFLLLATDGSRINRDEFADRAVLLVAFICNHCPFVKHIRAGLSQLAVDYQDADFAMVGINSNDTEAYPADDMEHMQAEVRAAGYVFPYLMDETQAVARAYDAACTPDFFLFDAERRLAYRGQFDDSRPNSGIPVTGRDLRAAIDALLAGRPVPQEQKPSIGCNLKWRNEA